MGVPRHLPKQIPLLVDDEKLLYSVILEGDEVKFSALSMGNPHAVIEVGDVESAPVARWGALLESHSLFPERVNVGFMQILDRQNIKLRVYERGASETLACGSGACAAVVAGIERGLLSQSVNVELLGGMLKIEWSGRNQPVYMTGPAISVFEGQIAL
jgi:diaminopimelate epimerase